MPNKIGANYYILFTAAESTKLQRKPAQEGDFIALSVRSKLEICSNRSVMYSVSLEDYFLPWKCLFQSFVRFHHRAKSTKREYSCKKQFT